MKFNVRTTAPAMPGPVIEELELEKKLKSDMSAVEDVEEDDHDEDSDDDSDDKEDIKVAQGGIDDSKQSRSEKKTRKAMVKLGMIPVTDVHKVTIKKSKDPTVYSISEPDVFKSPNSETYIIFGEPRHEDMSSQLQAQAAQQFRMPDLGSVMAKADLPAVNEADEEEDEEVDETGVNAADIELVVTQVGVSRNKAVKALKAQNGDLVGAIMDLTT